MQVPSSSVGPHNAKKNPTILTESTDHGKNKNKHFLLMRGVMEQLFLQTNVDIGWL